MTWREPCLLSAVFAVLTALGLFIFPGHSFLLSDSQIYLPLFTNLSHPSLLPNELILSGAHLSYTIYDEVTLSLASLTGLSFEQVLFGQQFAFRWIGYWGAYWLARACGLPMGPAVLTSTLLWLGAFVYGPAVITTEFEPVPRGFAVGLLVAALGAAAQHHRNLASLCLATAFLYHAPAVWPVLAIAIALRRWRPLAYTAAAAFVLLILARNQTGVIEAQPFFSLIDPTQRTIQQLRAPYNWISLWPARHWLQFLLTGGLAIAAYYRLRPHLPAILKPYLLYLPLIGIATMPLSWLLLEQFGWALLPQIQPMRALLFCHLLCQWLGIIAAWHELSVGKWFRAAAWLAVPLTLSLRGDILNLPTGALNNQLILLAIILTACAIAWRWR